MFKSDLKAEFIHRLSDKELSLDDRLNIAYGALISQDFCLTGKEQIIIDWFAKCFKEESSQLKKVFKTLTKFLKNDSLQTYSNTIDASKLVQAVVELDYSGRKKYSKHLAKCLLLLMKTSGFQRYCRFDVQPLCKTAILICEVWETAFTAKGVSEESFLDSDASPLDSIPEELCQCIHSIYKVTQQRSELQQQFVKSILPALLGLTYSFKESRKFQSLIEEVIIGENTELVCEAFKSETTKKIPPHLKDLVNLVIKNEQNCDLMTLSSLIYDEYVSSCLKNPTGEPNHLSLFYILSSVIGFQIQLPYNTVIATNIGTSRQLSIMKELVLVLQKHNVPSSSESSDGVLSHHLLSILKRLLSGEHIVSYELLHTVVNILNVYPESVRPVFSLIMLHVVFARKENKVIKSYDYLMMTIVKIFSDLNQLDKFFTLFFQGAVMISKEQNLPDLTSEMLLSKSFYSVLSEKLALLTGNQIKMIIGRLEKIFSKEFITPLETNSLQDGNSHLVFKLMVKVFCHILENAPVFVSTKWNIVSEDIHKLTLDVRTFGASVLSIYQAELNNKNEFLLEFLQLVKVMADLELVVNEYIISMSGKRILLIVKSKDRPDVHNLCKSHGFLTAREWNYISEIVMESSDTSLTNAWQDMLLQKYMRLGDAETLNYLIMKGDVDWLWNTVGNMALCVPLNCLETYTDKLLSNIAEHKHKNSLSFEEKLAALNNISVSSNRAFRVAMTFQSLKRLASSRNCPLSGIMVKLCDIQPLIAFETELSNQQLEKVVSIAGALAEIVNRHLWEASAPVVLNTGSKEYHLRLFDALSLMQSHSLKTETKRIVCLMLVGLSYDFRESDLLLSILDCILGCLDDHSPVIPDALDSQALFLWLTTIVPPDYPRRQQLSLAAVSKVVHSLETGLESVSRVLTENEDLLSAVLQSLISVHTSKRFKNKEDCASLVKSLVSLASSIISAKKPKPKIMKLYSLTLKAEFICVGEKSPFLLTCIPKYLEILLKGLAVSSVVDPDAMELVDLIFHHKDEIDTDVISTVNGAMLDELCKSNPCPVLCYPTTVKTYLESISSEMLELLFCRVQKKLTVDKEVSNVSEIWNLIVLAQASKDKAKVRNKMLVEVLSECHNILERDVSSCHSNLLQLLRSIAVTKSVSLAPKLLDLVLLILGEIPTDSEPNFLHDSLSVLSALINIRAELLFDRIPVFLQRIRKFIKSLVLLSPAENAHKLTFNTVSSTSMNLVTRIIKTMTDHHSKHFARISPYLIADILHLLVTYSVDTSVKNELQNCVCNLLSICDHHGTQLLQNLLPVASIELFKVISMTYNKNYKYTGKV